jgi:hypothetical protein
VACALRGLFSAADENGSTQPCRIGSFRRAAWLAKLPTT